MTTPTIRPLDQGCYAGCAALALLRCEQLEDEAPALMAYGKTRHCYICKRKAGAKEDRKEFKDDPRCQPVRIYASTPRCVPCQRIFSRRSYHVRKAKDIEMRNRARAQIGMPLIDEEGSDAPASA